MPNVIELSASHQQLQRRKRWVECADARHATEGPRTAPGGAVATLCGMSVVIVVPKPGIYAPECSACDRQWRADEGIPQREAHVRIRRPTYRSETGRAS
jgi:hypothetical protein